MTCDDQEDPKSPGSPTGFSFRSVLAPVEHRKERAEGLATLLQAAPSDRLS